MEKPTSISFTMRIPNEQDQAIENYKKEHKIPKKTQTILILVKKGLSVEEIIKKNNHAHNLEIKKKDELVEMLRAGRSLKECFEQACEYLDYDEFGKAFCRNRNAPIKTNDLTPRACMICGKLRKEIGKSEKRRKPATSRIDKKKAKDKYCLGLNTWINSDLNQAKCQNCQLHSRDKWVECTNYNQALIK